MQKNIPSNEVDTNHLLIFSSLGFALSLISSTSLLLKAVKPLRLLSSLTHLTSLVDESCVREHLADSELAICVLSVLVLNVNHQVELLL